jgi:hypothetical protein
VSDARNVIFKKDLKIRATTTFDDMQSKNNHSSHPQLIFSSLLEIIILFILNCFLHLSNLVFTEADMSGIKNTLNYQITAIYCRFKGDLSIAYEVKCYKLAESFLFS